MAKDKAILIAFGANLNSAVGAPHATFLSAIDVLRQRGIAIERVSTFLRTPAFPPGSGQPDFLNGVLSAHTPTPPEQLLDLLLELEVGFGRTRDNQWAPRSLDLDLLCYGNLVSKGYWVAAAAGQVPPEIPPRLILPHPRLHFRRFVLEPIVEIEADWCHPALGLTAQQLLKGIKS